MHSVFRDLGNEIEDRWSAIDYEEMAFPELAAELLGKHALASRVTIDDIADYVISQPHLPMQPDLSSNFGQPPVTMFVSKTYRFYIHALFWLDSTTSVHEHSFSGAFSLIRGRSLQSRFSFAPERVVSPQLVFGQLHLRKVELLSPGDVVPIRLGRDFIHSAFHLDRPSVTVVVRTMLDTGRGVQYRYRRPYLADDDQFTNPLLKRTLQVLGAVSDYNPERYVKDSLQLVSRCDVHTALRVLDQASERMTEEAFQNLTRRFVDRFPWCGPQVAAVLDVDRRERHIVNLRTKTRDPAQRQVLALLLNLSRRTDILDMVRVLWKTDDPAGKLAELLGQMGRGEHAEATSIGMLLDDLAVAVIDGMLRAATLEGLREHLGATFEDADLVDSWAHIVELRAALLANPILAPLWAE